MARSYVRQNVVNRFELQPRSGERNYDSLLQPRSGERSYDSLLQPRSGERSYDASMPSQARLPTLQTARQ